MTVHFFFCSFLFSFSLFSLFFTVLFHLFFHFFCKKPSLMSIFAKGSERPREPNTTDIKKSLFIPSSSLSLSCLFMFCSLFVVIYLKFVCRLSDSSYCHSSQKLQPMKSAPVNVTTAVLHPTKISSNDQTYIPTAFPHHPPSLHAYLSFFYIILFCYSVSSSPQK